MSAQTQSSPNEEQPLFGDMIISNAIPSLTPSGRQYGNSPIPSLTPVGHQYGNTPMFVSEIPVPDNNENKKEEIIPDTDKKEEEETNLDNEVDALNNNKVDVEIEPDVKSNDVVVQICSCSVALNCFSWKFGK